jgi:hypothetical protein
LRSLPLNLRKRNKSFKYYTTIMLMNIITTQRLLQLKECSLDMRYLREK